jgi:hypothetical protein
MINFFDNIYNSIVNRSRILERIRYYSLLRFIVRLCANIIIPPYLVLTPNKKCYSLENCLLSEKRVIVSLTSFPARINRVWIVIESILRQEKKPDIIILWLSIEQFPTLESLPGSLKKLQQRGLTVRLCPDDLKSHKKYYYAFKEFPEDYIITIDDDVIYNSKLLSYLINLNHKFPSAVCCNHAQYIKASNGKISSYSLWASVNDEHGPTNRIMAIGIGGVLYPPNSLIADVFNIDVFKKYCFNADDIWLNLMGRLNGTKTAKTNYNSVYLPVINSKNVTLASKNLHENQNDKQLESLRSYYLNKLGIDPYQNIIDTINETYTV